MNSKGHELVADLCEVSNTDAYRRAETRAIFEH